MNIKDNAKFLGLGIAIIIALIVFINENNRKRINEAIERNRQTVIGITTGCYKNIRSSLYILNYQFNFHNMIFQGTGHFDKAKRGDICRGVRFLIEFDSLKPENSRILLDSLISEKN